jgi:hypothetical protein
LTHHINPLNLLDEQFLKRARMMCTTKVPHVNRQAATAHLRRGGYPGTPYHCRICGSWHITKYNKAQAKQFARRLSRLLRKQH